MVKSKSPKKDSGEFQSEVLSKKEQRQLKKLQKKQEEQQEEDVEEDEHESEEEEEEQDLDFDKLARDADSEEEEEEEEQDAEDAEEEEQDDEDEEDVPLSEVEIDSDADIVPHTKLTVNNVAALKDSLSRIQLPWSKHSFQEHQSVTSSEDVVSQVKDIYDDTERELAFYKQGLDAAKLARQKLLALKVPFSRPLDYFAEMVKSDEHMDKLKQKLVKEATAKRASEDAKKQRQLKKFGKQVQNETLQKRQKEKRETLDKIKSLKKRKQDKEMTNDDFDIAIEEATAAREEHRDRNGRSKPNSKRMAKDSKFGQGGMKRFKRKNDADSSNDVSGFNAKRMKSTPAKKPRPGKSRRRRN